MKPEFLVMHYTAAPSAANAISWFLDSASRASAHLVIARDGGITQMVAFDRVAWHAGESRWMGRGGLNQCSIGIELDNAGRLERRGSRWVSWFGSTIPESEVLRQEGVGWHTFPRIQLDAAAEVAALLVREYRLMDVVGHQDISPGRKVDPGFAFPMAGFRARALGGEFGLRTVAAANVRVGPGVEFPPVSGSPLRAGTTVRLLAGGETWVKVQVTGREGWIHGRLLAGALQ